MYILYLLLINFVSGALYFTFCISIYRYNLLLIQGEGRQPDVQRGGGGQGAGQTLERDLGRAQADFPPEVTIYLSV